MESTQTLMPEFYFKGPISALLIQNYGTSKRLLVGEGSVLAVYDLSQKIKIKEFQMFSSCFKILNISMSDDAEKQSKRIIVKTEKSMKVLDQDNYSVIYDFDKHGHDKIVQEKLVGHNLYIINAHNFIEQWDLSSMTLVYRRFCEEECILYSADLNLQNNLIAGGTVFRSILIWENFSNQEQQTETSKVLYRLEGHAGVIFDVKFLKQNQIASVSDDRSLKIWSIDLQEHGKYHLVKEFYGHRSRIWRLAELGYNDLLITVSEDATCKIWNQHSNDNRAIETLKGHQGKNVRALSCYEGLIATGGDDGAVKIWNAEEILMQKQKNQENNQAIIHQYRLPMVESKNQNMEEGIANEEQKVEDSVEIQESQESDVKQKKKKAKVANPKDQVNQIRAIEIIQTIDQNNNSIPYAIAVTNKGSIYGIDMSSSDFKEPRLLFYDENQLNIQDINALTIKSQDKVINLVAISIGDGIAILFKVDLQQNLVQIARIQTCDIKVLNVFLIDESHTLNEDQIGLIASNGRAELIKYSIKNFNDVDIVISQPTIYKVEIKTQFICLVYSSKLNIAVAGDTKGNLFSFDFSQTSDQPLLNFQQLKAHKNERVISLFLDESKGQLYSTSKDNYINVYNFDENKQIQKIQSIKEEDLNIIYNINMMNNKMVLLGFYGNFAYIWNKQENMQIFSIDTKGGNRPLKLKIQEGTNIDEQLYGKHYAFAYSFGDCLVLCNNWLYSSEEEQKVVQSQYTIRECFHGREILCASGFSLKSDKKIILTGGEDSFLKISEYSTNNKDFKMTQSFSNHVASIRSISKAKYRSANLDEGFSQRTYYVLSAGSRMQANLFYAKLNQDNFEMSHLCNFMRSSEQDEEQDFRIMSSAIICHQNQGETVPFVICAFGTSSGELQVFTYHHKKRRLEDLYKIALLSSILTMKKVKVSSNSYAIICGLSNGGIYVLTLKIDQATSQIIVEPSAELEQVHDFGVNTLDACYLKEYNSLVIVSGGDDQQISLLRLELEQSDEGQIKITMKGQFKQYAHSSCIKGLVLSKCNGQLKVASSSYDQRYKEWMIDGDKLVETKTVRHCMSDMNGITIIKSIDQQSSEVCLVGQGISIFQMK
ncbi:wd40 repeat domain-containing protein [Stylonychia lemnae]|uniref:Wd40 repeat domain-containing protein n=1 Tax=Stylonychia lemnae TaxID=5949 RepID=A0A078B5F6_STYLE|nr:wd40 repeat domain-containing protein [Stylonychia lemnae]|eukprot:CDW88527.1 wd40 repeat domain-containing protein [Stylonychia lemnae]